MTAGHVHKYAPTFTVSRFTGTPSRPCTVDGCGAVTLDPPPYRPDGRRRSTDCAECCRTFPVADAYYGDGVNGDDGAAYCPPCWWGTD